MACSDSQFLNCLESLHVAGPRRCSLHHLGVSFSVTSPWVKEWKFEQAERQGCKEGAAEEAGVKLTCFQNPEQVLCPDESFPDTMHPLQILSAASQWDSCSEPKALEQLDEK